MKRIFLGIVLMGFMGAGSLMAQDWRPDRDLRHDYRDRRADYRDMRNDQVKIARDRQELRQALRSGNYAEAREERNELRSEYRDLNRDRIDARREMCVIGPDGYWDWVKVARTRKAPVG